MNDISINLGNKKSYSLIAFYYLILLVFAMSWTNKELVEPNRIIRIIFSIAFFSPLIFYQHLAPAIITIFATIRLFSVAPYGYLPSEPKLYLYVAIALYLNSLRFNLMAQKTNKALIALLIMSVFSNLANYAIKSHEYDFIRLLIISILFNKLFINRDDVKLMEQAFIIVTFCLSIYGLIFYKDFVVQIYGNQDIERMYWNDPNYLGCILDIGIVIAFYNLLKNAIVNKIYWVFNLVTFIMGLAFIGIFASRGAFIALLVPIIFILIKNINSIKSIFRTIIIIVFFVFGFSSLFVFEPIIERFQEQTVYTGSSRTVIWEKSFDLFINSDIKTLFLGGGSEYSYQICGKPMNQLFVSPHNNYLEILYDYGIVGLLIFIYLIINWFKSNSKNELAISLVLLFVASSISLSPLMYLPFWLLIVLIENQKLKLIE